MGLWDRVHLLGKGNIVKCLVFHMMRKELAELYRGAVNNPEVALIFKKMVTFLL